MTIICPAYGCTIHQSVSDGLVLCFLSQPCHSQFGRRHLKDLALVKRRQRSLLSTVACWAYMSEFHFMSLPHGRGNIAGAQCLLKSDWLSFMVSPLPYLHVLYPVRNFCAKGDAAKFYSKSTWRAHLYKFQSDF